MTEQYVFSNPQIEVWGYSTAGKINKYGLFKASEISMEHSKVERMFKDMVRKSTLKGKHTGFPENDIKAQNDDYMSQFEDSFLW